MSKVELRTTEDVRLWLERWARALDEPSVDPVRVIAAGKIGEVIRLVVKRSAVATVPDPPLAVEADAARMAEALRQIKEYVGERSMVGLGERDGPTIAGMADGGLGFVTPKPDEDGVVRHPPSDDFPPG